MSSDSFDGPSDLEFDVAFPPQLCDICFRPLDASAPHGHGMQVDLTCPDHGPRGHIDARDSLGPQAI